MSTPGRFAGRLRPRLRRRLPGRWVLLGIVIAGAIALGGVFINKIPTFWVQVLGGSFLIVLLLATVLAFPEKVTNRDWSTGVAVDAAKARNRNEVRTSLLQAFASTLVLLGAFAAFGQLRASQREVRATSQNQQTERFSRAVEQLAATTGPAVRLGGIFTLIELANQEPAERPVVAQILAAYVQRNAPRPATLPDATDEPTIPLQLSMPDIQACLDFLSAQPPGKHILSKLLLNRVSLRGVLFSDGAQLEGARLRTADLTGATIVHGHLSRADLTSAVLTKAGLAGAELRQTTLADAQIDGADLTRADLSGADLTAANLHGTDLVGASLRNAVLIGADLSSVRLIGADVSGADMRHVDLRAADLRSTSGLPKADLTDAQCDADRTLLPSSGNIRCDDGLLRIASG